jgi:colanic acid biosynthesis glycosyl transferase WcaI
MTLACDGDDVSQVHFAEKTTSPARGKVLIYGMNYAPEIAGVGKYTGEIAEYLNKIGADVTVVTTPPHYPGWRVQTGYKNRYSTTVSAGIKVIRSPLLLRQKMGGVWRLIAPLTFAISSAPVVAWQILVRRPDTVFCVEPTLIAAPVAQFAAKLVGARTVLHVQDLEVDAAFAVGHLGSMRWLKAIGYAFERSTLRRFNKVVTISNRMAEKLIEKGVSSANVSVIRNWVDLSHIYPMDTVSSYRSELGFSPNDFVVLYSGNIGAKQGLDVLIDVVQEFAKNEKIHFVIAGEGPAKLALQDRGMKFPNLRFLPFQPYARLNEFMNMADLHVLPQDRGAADLVLPSKLGGMLASGKHVLVTADEDTELAQFVLGTATVVAPGDVAAMSAAISQLSGAVSKPEEAVRMRLVHQVSKDGEIEKLAAIVMPC